MSSSIPSCFVDPADFIFDNERRVDSDVRSAAAANFDFSANKFFPVYERVTGKFSLETFNLFNRAQFDPPDTNVKDGAYGTVRRRVNLPRTLQLVLRLSF